GFKAGHIPCFDQFVGSLPEQDQAALHKALRSESTGPFCVTLQLGMHDSQPRVVTLRRDVVRNDEGEPIEAGGTVQSVDPVPAESERPPSEQRYLALFEYAPD